MQCDEDGGVGDYDDQEGQEKHGQESEGGIELLLSEAPITTVGDALVEVLCEGAARHVENNQLKFDSQVQQFIFLENSQCSLRHNFNNMILKLINVT